MVVNITQPSVMGYTVTPWLIVLIVFFIAAVVLSVLLIVGLARSKKNDRKLVENASKIKAKASADKRIVPGTTKSMAYEKTAADFGGRSGRVGPDDKTEGVTLSRLADRGISDDKTEGIIRGGLTSGLMYADTTGEWASPERTVGIGNGEVTEAVADLETTTGLSGSTVTEGIGSQTESMTVGMTESKTESCGVRARFCGKCGTKVVGRFCGVCGSKIE